MASAAYLAPYAASKAAAWSYTNQLRLSLHERGIQILGLHVGFVDTDLTHGIDVPKASPEDVVRQTYDALALGKSEVMADKGTALLKSTLAAEIPGYITPPAGFERRGRHGAGAAARHAVRGSPYATAAGVHRKIPLHLRVTYAWRLRDQPKSGVEQMLPVSQPLGIDQCNCFAVRKASRQISRLYDSHLGAGLRITQFLTLAALSEVGSTPVNALAERLDIERTAMGKMVGFLGATAASRSSRRPRTAEAA